MNIEQRISLTQRSLKGLSIGDAFGDSFFGPIEEILDHIERRTIPNTSWEFTDDTVMAIAIYDQLRKNKGINQDELAEKFVKNHQLDTNRGYGATVRRVLRGIEEEEEWRILAPAVFDGMGSMGNGAAMRVSPIGAFYFDDLEKVKLLSRQSSEITHTNEEAIVGAMAIAISTSLATKYKFENRNDLSAKTFIEQIIQELPPSDTRAKINKSLSVPYSYRIKTVESILGNGSKMLAQDTVPFAIWCAAHNLNNFEEALWKAVSILGDRDTICAMVGGIVMMSSNEKYIPKKWQESVEKIQNSQFL